MSTQMVLTHTGKIYFDKSLGLEFLTVGDYGKENNIKADFLGLTKKIEGVHHHDVNLMDKWVATISSQKGCPMKCTFCDVHKYGFMGTPLSPIWNIKSGISLSTRMSVLQIDSMSIMPVWESQPGTLQYWNLPALGWMIW